MFGAVLNRIGNHLAGANRIDRALVIVGNMKMAPMSDREAAAPRACLSTASAAGGGPPPDSCSSSVELFRGVRIGVPYVPGPLRGRASPLIHRSYAVAVARSRVADYLTSVSPDERISSSASWHPVAETEDAIADVKALVPVFRRFYREYPRDGSGDVLEPVDTRIVRSWPQEFGAGRHHARGEIGLQTSRSSCTRDAVVGQATDRCTGRAAAASPPRCPVCKRRLTPLAEPAAVGLVSACGSKDLRAARHA